MFFYSFCIRQLILIGTINKMDLSSMLASLNDTTQPLSNFSEMFEALDFAKLKTKAREKRCQRSCNEGVTKIYNSSMKEKLNRKVDEAKAKVAKAVGDTAKRQDGKTTNTSRWQTNPYAVVMMKDMATRVSVMMRIANLIASLESIPICVLEEIEPITKCVAELTEKDIETVKDSVRTTETKDINKLTLMQLILFYFDDAKSNTDIMRIHVQTLTKEYTSKNQLEKTITCTYSTGRLFKLYNKLLSGVKTSAPCSVNDDDLMDDDIDNSHPDAMEGGAAAKKKLNKKSKSKSKKETAKGNAKWMRTDKKTKTEKGTRTIYTNAAGAYATRTVVVNKKTGVKSTKYVCLQRQ